MSKKQAINEVNKVSDSELEKLSGGGVDFSHLPIHGLAQYNVLTPSSPVSAAQPDYNSGGKGNKSGKGGGKKDKKHKKK
ncbi:hypothetical protein Lbir_1341 [Legionella birminghamensis]|uniref:Uncharacterized protein n=1 Tax=Legionella birminghamensis TaxID=28083 RepID=A0A378IC87_9GAMM|nr:hypothetical protein [Legionella birminghamensis]KTC72566.1 hypothetical protein Lbir_1341 [Legionella birminghamensis]STX32838.1 Uncharacterised protein [Legionella birminghamensis]